MTTIEIIAVIIIQYSLLGLVLIRYKNPPMEIVIPLALPIVGPYSLFYASAFIAMFAIPVVFFLVSVNMTIFILNKVLNYKIDYIY